MKSAGKVASSVHPIAPKQVRYIKLGAGGAWVDHCLDQGELQFGYKDIPHEPCLAGNWNEVLDLLTRTGRSTAKARDALREIRDFYSLSADCLWITFARGHLWWAFAAPEVIWLGPEEDGRGARMRKTIDGWHKTDIKGEALATNALSSRLTQVAAYRQTICAVKASDYLLDRINGIDPPVVTRARAAKDAMVAVAAEMVRDLHWGDFETLVDLIFARSGWQRVSRVGGTQADIDLILRQPTTGETAFVQVKSQARQSVLDDYIERFRASEACDRGFFVCHTESGSLQKPGDAKIHIWAGSAIADAAVAAGLFDWLVERSV